MPTSASAARSASAPAETSLSGSTQMTSAAASGRTMRSVVIGSPDRHEDDAEDGDAGGDRKCVRAQQTGLPPGHETAEVARVLSERVRGLVDERLLDPA